MKNDPYAKLGRLDQVLFEQRRPTTTTKQRDNEATLPRNNGATQQRNVEARNAGARPRTSAATTHGTLPRPDERHSHDIYHDQVRWMNRVKLDIQERYDKRVTSNGIVQLALDLLIDDYEVRGRDSSLIRALVLGSSSRRGESG